MKKKTGFTLIEVMITVVIIGILASIAYPSYTGFIAKGARADGLAGLMAVANRQEQYYLDNRSYTTDMTKLGFNADPWVVENTFYEIDSTIAAGVLTISATAKGVQATRDSACASITLTDSGLRSPEECW
ncbi:prepilin-type N-terminal cleavage/methylation domain-containing protein [Shewanella electrodiphila]|uniref:Prepilin-type N-terminal cleavage/methylation domain-containing protein n=1 Tax=Shewanella electrodiphila TaxID=934143 RepID=A0ABT0KJR4_9GAMM|nr:type IV pilin protein [Shewanella electrodiphila]MCL1044076.1 prepilin-type N-terminal cleavage/methylation domain-containing protein [Shewanella electrodiphila]